MISCSCSQHDISCHVYRLPEEGSTLKKTNKLHIAASKYGHGSTLLFNLKNGAQAVLADMRSRPEQTAGVCCTQGPGGAGI